MYQQFVNQALKTINTSSPKIVNNNKIYYRNRVIDLAVRLAIKDKTILLQLYDEVYPSIANDETRANHYGVKIGTIIGYHGWNKNHSDYWKRLAKLYKQIKYYANQSILVV
jgi:hypothetical protein